MILEVTPFIAGAVTRDGFLCPLVSITARGGVTPGLVNKGAASECSGVGNVTLYPSCKARAKAFFVFSDL